MSEDSVIEALADEIIELVLANVVCNVDSYMPEGAEVEAIPQLNEDIEVRARIKELIKSSTKDRVTLETVTLDSADS